MRQLQRILLATDFRPASLEAVHVASHLARTFGSQLLLLHVQPSGPRWSVPAHPSGGQAIESLRQVSEQLTHQGVQVCELPDVVGSPADIIVDTAHRLDVDLILIGAGERSKFDTFAVGPIAEMVMQHATQPVLAIRPEPPKTQFQKVLCPIDHSDASLRALRNAIRLTKAFHGELVVLSVVPPVRPLKSKWIVPPVNWVIYGGSSMSDVVAAEHEATWRSECDEFLKQVDLGDVKWSRVVRSGVPQEEIVEAVNEHDADVLVMGSTGRTGLMRLLMGSVTRRVIQHLPCSLLTVKREDALDESFEERLNRLRMRFDEGQVLLEEKSFDAALARFSAVLAYNPYDIPALEGCAMACEKLGQTSRAERCRKRAALLRQKS